MKIMLIHTMLLISIIPMCHADSAPESIVQAKKCIAQIKNSEKENYPIADFIDCEIIGSLEHRPPFKALVSIVVKDWSILLDHYVELAPDRKSGAYLLHAMLYLPPDEYMKSLFRTLELHKSGQIGKDEFKHIILMPPNVSKDENPADFLSYNYKHPDVVKFLNDVQKYYKDQGDNSLDGLIQHFLSGEGKLSKDNIRKDAKDKSKLPMLSAPSTTTDLDNTKNPAGQRNVVTSENTP